MTTLIRLTELGGEIFYLNADKILYVKAFDGVVKGTLVYHEPYNSENVLDWCKVKETPDEIVRLSGIPERGVKE